MKRHTLVLLATAIPASAAITVDGNFADWLTVSTLVTDPADAGANPESDFLVAKAASDSNNLYLYYQTSATFDLNAIGWRFNVFLDTDQTPNTGFKLYGASAGGFDFLFQGATLYTFQGTDNTNEWNWGWSPTLPFGNAGNEAEFAIPLASLGLSPGDSVDFIIFGDNGTSDFVPDNFGSSVITYALVPEPGALALGGIGMLAMLRRRR